jgi:hypothetical protein
MGEGDADDYMCFTKKDDAILTEVLHTSYFITE